MLKKNRLMLLEDLVENNVITTQEELLDKLRENGMGVTQATVSRDIKELRIMKGMDRDGNYRYVLPEKPSADLGDKFKSIFAHSVKSADYAGNTLVIHCYIGMAQAACAAFDSMEWQGLVGTLAGDDTVFVLCRTEEFAHRMKTSINAILGINAE